MARQVWVWDLRQHYAERDQRGVHGFDEEQAGHALHIGHDLTAPRHDVRQVRELRIHQHHLGHGLGGGRRIAHGDAEVSLLDGERVVDAVAGHSHHVVLRVQRLHDGLLLVRQHAAEHIDVFEHAGQFVHVLGQFARVHRHRLMVACQFHSAGDGTHGHWIVTGNHTTAHTLLTEPSERPLGVLANLLRAQHQRHRLSLHIQLRVVRDIGSLNCSPQSLLATAPLGEGSCRPRNQQHTVAVIGILVNLLQHRRIVTLKRRNNHLRRSHVPGLAGFTHRTPFARRRERDTRLNRTCPISLGLEPGEYGLAGAVGLLFVAAVVEGLRGCLFRSRIGGIEHHEPVEGDTAIGDRAGFIEVQRVHASQCLHGFKLLHQRIVTGETHGGHREVQRSQQHQAFGNHAYYAGDRGNHGLPPFAGGECRAPTADRMNLRKNQQNTQRYHEEGHEFQNRVDALVQVGHGFLVYLGLRGERGGVGMAADRIDLDQCHAGDRGGTGIHLLPHLVAHGTRFAGEHGFVEFQSPGLDDLPVGRHLFAGTDPQQVVEHDLVVGHLHVPAVTMHEEFGGHKDGKLIQRALGPEFGDDADARVDDDDETEHRVPPGTGDQHQYHRGEDDAVEQREYVGSHDILNRTRGGGFHRIRLATFDTLHHFFGGKTGCSDLRHFHGCCCTHIPQPTASCFAIH